MRETFYITTPIYYPSNKFTLGNCYTTVICDSIARFNKKLGKDVFFLTGTDEHGQKIAKVASEHGLSEKKYLDEIVEDSKNLWAILDVEYDKFIRTTDEQHVKAVQKIFSKLYQDGYIYKSSYSGLYCVPCESFWTESQLVDGRCPDCHREVINQKEEAYFFKLSMFADKLLNLYKEHPEFLKPDSRVNEMVQNFIVPGLNDLCVSRTSVKWGVEVPFDKNHTIYVWLDALLNYLTALGYMSEDDSLFKKYWPANVHIMGKEIVRFHAIIWPSILMALKLPLPKQIFGHGWLLFGGDKLSKSKETKIKEVLDPRVLIELYGVDAVRYILLREIPFGSDGVYTTERFLSRYNFDLANDFGNLVSRSFSMLKKYFNGTVPQKKSENEDDKKLILDVSNCAKLAKESMENFDVSKAISEIFNIFKLGNKYIEVSMPWVLNSNNDERLQTVLFNLINLISTGCKLLNPFLTKSTKIVLDAIGETEFNFENIEKISTIEAGRVVENVPVLFPRLDIQKEMEKLSKIANENN